MVAEADVTCGRTACRHGETVWGPLPRLQLCSYDICTDIPLRAGLCPPIFVATLLMYGH